MNNLYTKKKIFKIYNKINNKKKKATKKIMKRKIFQVLRTVRKKRSNWTKEQDKLLIQAASITRNKKWLLASKLIKDKTPFQCHQRFKLLNPNLKKGKWSAEEDAKLIQLVATFGKSWNIISKLFKTRSNKQIMNRYEEYLNDSVELKDFSQAEDSLIFQYFPKFGKNWNLYREILPNRSCRKIKKRFFLLLRAKKIIINKSGFRRSVCGTTTNIEDLSFSPTTDTENEFYQSQNCFIASPNSQFCST